jgi:hypothetical protein
MTEVLLDHPNLSVTLDRDAGILRYARTDRAWSSLDDVRRAHDAVVKLVLGTPRGAYSALLDLRRAPPRNDDEYEKTIEGYVGLLLGHFGKHALLVRTAAGRLQVMRLERRAGRRGEVVFHDEAEALAYLRG